MRPGYNVTVEKTRDHEKATLPIGVYLTRSTEGNGTRMPMGYFDSLEQAGTVATYLQRALHEEHLRGMDEAYDRALSIIGKLTSSC